MDKLVIHGQREIGGEVQISGSKNAALPILISTILTPEKVELTNVPMLQDIFTTKKLLNVLGVNVKSEGNNFVVQANKLNQFFKKNKIKREFYSNNWYYARNNLI